MTIDASNFRVQGKPAKHIVKAVWDQMPHPSIRKVASLLNARGYSISYRSVARWKENNWEESPEKAIKEKRPQSLSNFEKELVAEASFVATPERIVAQQLASGIIPTQQLTGDEMETLTRRAQLMEMSEIELDAQEAKARRIMNIILMEQAAKRAHALVLIPKEVGNLVEAMTDARKVMNSGNDVPPGNPRPGEKNGEVIDIVPNPQSELSSTIDKFFKDEGIAV